MRVLVFLSQNRKSIMRKDLEGHTGEQISGDGEVQGALSGLGLISLEERTDERRYHKGLWKHNYIAESRKELAIHYLFQYKKRSCQSKLLGNIFRKMWLLM